MSDRPIFVVSDLHMGDEGPRDNFAHMSGGNREQEFHHFLDYVADEGGELYILGDLFELWQGNLSQVLTCRRPLMDRLAQMGATYLLGNHDIDLRHFTDVGGLKLAHPLFDNLYIAGTLFVAGKKILLIHGHEQDVYCKSDIPGIGRISAIYSGLKEDRNGGPLAGKYGAATVESRCMSRFDRWSKLARRLIGYPSTTQVMRKAVVDTFNKSGCDALIYGHTHEPGQFAELATPFPGRRLPIYNSGTWAESVNSFVRIEPDAEITVMNWAGYQATLNTNLLTVK